MQNNPASRLDAWLDDTRDSDSTRYERETGAAPLSLLATVYTGWVDGDVGDCTLARPLDYFAFLRRIRGRTVIVGKEKAKKRNLTGAQRIIIASERDEAESFSHDFKLALALAYLKSERPLVVGSASLFAQALPYATMLYLTEITGTREGGVLFPAWDRSAWALISSLELSMVEGKTHRFLALQRIRGEVDALRRV